MPKYKFKAKSLKTGKWVEGDLIHAYTVNEKVKIKPMIVEVRIHGGMIWVHNKTLIDENTLELITEE